MIISDKGKDYKVTFPDTLKEFVTRYGEETTYFLCQREYIQSIRNLITRKRRKGFTSEEIQAEIDSYQPRFKLKTRVRRFGLNILEDENDNNE